MSVIFSFAPVGSEDKLYEYDDSEIEDYYIYSIYDPELDDNVYRVEGAHEKMNRAARKIEPTRYVLGKDEYWVRFDYESIIEGEPERV